jgi:dihydroorotate dehydrogenase (NAD+) catalytic subunit
MNPRSLQNPDLSVTLGRLKLKNPVMVASGTFGYGEEFADFMDLGQLGAVIPKGISLNPMAGNPPPRIFETEGGLLNSIGLHNPGFEGFVKDKLPYLRKIRTHLLINIFGNTTREYIELAKRFDDVPGISGLELNISCPNVKCGGAIFGSDPRVTYRLTLGIRKVTTLPLIVKLSPNVGDIVAIAKAAEEGGADAVSLVNTFKAMAINIDTLRPELGNIIGGLSGPAIKPIAVRMVWEVCQHSKIPVIGIGGIWRAEDAIEFILAGASAVQVGTANLVHPKAGIHVMDGIKEYLIQKKRGRLREIIGLFNHANAVKPGP